MSRSGLHVVLGLLLFSLTVGSVSFVFFSSEAKGHARGTLVDSTKIKTVQICTGTGNDRVCRTEERVVEVKDNGNSNNATVGVNNEDEEDGDEETQIVGSYPEDEDSDVGSQTTPEIEDADEGSEVEGTDEEVTDSEGGTSAETEITSTDEGSEVEGTDEEVTDSEEDPSLIESIKEKVVEKVCKEKNNEKSNGKSNSIWCNGQEEEGGNSAPVFISDPIASSDYHGSEGFHDGLIDHLVAGGSASLYIHGIIEDLNGQTDITQVDASLFMNGKMYGCVTNKLDCYRKEPCTITLESDLNQISYDCEFDLEYWMRPTDEYADPDHRSKKWYLTVVAQDSEGEKAYNTQRDFEVAAITGLQLIGEINFGTIAVGQETSAMSNFEQQIIQGGNVAQDLLVVMEEEEFSCSDSEQGIPRENLQWAIVDVGYGDLNSYSISDNLTEVDLNLIEQEDAALGVPETILYWNLNVPEGVDGTCTATIGIYAKNAYY